MCSKEWVIRQYDHEVQAGSVVKPLVGAHSDGPSDAAVVRPDLRRIAGPRDRLRHEPAVRRTSIPIGWPPRPSTKRSAIASPSEPIPARIAILDNFCWGNTERPEVLGSLVRAALACRDVAIAWSTPFISGKDSLNNEFSYVDDSGRRQTVSIPPSLLISALGPDRRYLASRHDGCQRAGQLDLSWSGQTRDELGAVISLSCNGLEGGDGSESRSGRRAADFSVRSIVAISRGLVRSCHDLSEGGLAVAAAEMAFAGDRGIELDLSPLRTSSGLKEAAVLLFSESNTRFLVEVPPENGSAFESLFSGLPLSQLGCVTDARDCS